MILTFRSLHEPFNLNFQSLEVVSRYRETQLQVTENVCYLRNIRPNIYQCFKIKGIFYSEQLVLRGYARLIKDADLLLHQSTSVLYLMQKNIVRI